MKNLWVKKKFFDLIVEGKKTLEVRVLYPSLRSIQKGDLISLNKKAIIRVKDIRLYPNFETMLQYEDASKILPGSNREEVLRCLQSLYSPQKERLGVFVFEIELVK